MDPHRNCARRADYGGTVVPKNASGLHERHDERVTQDLALRVDGTSLSQPPAEATPLVLTVTAAARLLGISRALAYELVARGEIPSLRLGRRLVVPRARLLALLESTTSP
jgi:excisionase family DNA binding protein